MVKNEKISLKQFVWNGFNYIFGITFMNYFSSLVMSENGQNGLGLNIIWIFLLAACVAFVCTFCIKKTSEKLQDADHDGGIMLYSLKSFKNKRIGVFAGTIQFFMFPIVIATQSNMIIKNVFSPSILNFSDNQNIEIPTNILDLGPFTNLILSLCGIAIMCGCMLVCIKGIGWFKKVLNYSSLIKWVTSAPFIILAIYFACSKSQDNIPFWYQNSNLEFGLFVKAFNTSFYLLCGFEILITSAKSLENPKKDVGKGIVLTMMVSITSVIIFMLILLCAFDAFSSNTDIFEWSQNGIPYILSQIGLYMSIFTIIFMYINAAVQDGLYSAATLSPLASINFFSKKITATNKKGIPVKSIVTFVGIILIFDFILLIIPDFIQGFKTLGCYNDYGDSREGHIKAISLSKEPFDVSSLSQAAGAMALCLYAISFLCLLNLELKNNKKNWKLDIPCFISFIIVCSMFLYHYVQEIIDVTNNIGNELFMPNLVKLVAELCIVIIILIVFFLRYKKTIYYEKTHK